VYGGELYLQGLTSIPEISSEISFDGDLGGGSKSSVSALAYSINQSDRDYLSRLIWEGSIVTVLIGQDGDDIATFQKLAILEVQSASIADYLLTLEFRDWREKMLIPLTRRLLGTGGYEGTSNDQGRVLPRGFGIVRYAPADYVKKSTLIRRFCQGDVHSVSRVQSRGIDIPIESYASGISALEALTITPGMCAIDLQNGAVRSRLELADPVTVSFVGEGHNSIGMRLFAIANYLMNNIVLPDSSFTTLQNLIAVPGGLLLRDNETLADALDKILLGIGCWWGVDVATGKVECGRLDFEFPVETFSVDDVAEIEMETAKAPFWQRRLAFAVNNRPLSDGEVALSLVDQDARDAAARALQAANNANQNALLAQNQAASVSSRVNDIAADNILDTGEKPDLVRILGDISNEYLVIDGAAQAFGTVVERTAYQNAKTALDFYIAELFPPVTNYAVNTLIVRSTLNGKLGDYFYARRWCHQNKSCWIFYRRRFLY
jgi:hypothetical protein